MFENTFITVSVLLLCVGLSFLFSGMESGVMALNRLRIRQAARQGDRRAVVLQTFLSNSEDFLWTILVGNTLANLVIFSVVFMQFGHWLAGEPVWFAVAFFAMVFVFYVVCELVPKSLFQKYPNRLSLFLARPFRAIHSTLAPLSALVAWFARGLLRWSGGQTFTGQLFGGREELRQLMQESTPGLTSEEKAMVNRVLDLQSRRVRHVMVPLENAVTVKDKTPVSQVLALSREREITRMPVINSDTGRVIGIINAQDLMLAKDLSLDKPAADCVQPAIFIKSNILLEDALHRMQRGGARLAVVLDANHAEIGIISLQDILKAIFGEVTL